MALDIQKEKAKLPKGENCLFVWIFMESKEERSKEFREERSKESIEERSKESKEKTSRRLKIEDPISHSKLLASIISLEIRVVDPCQADVKETFTSYPAIEMDRQVEVVDHPNPLFRKEQEERDHFHHLPCCLNMARQVVGFTFLVERARQSPWEAILNAFSLWMFCKRLSRLPFRVFFTFAERGPDSVTAKNSSPPFLPECLVPIRQTPGFVTPLFADSIWQFCGIHQPGILSHARVLGPTQSKSLDPFGGRSDGRRLKLTWSSGGPVAVNDLVIITGGMMIAPPGNDWPVSAGTMAGCQVSAC
ncbi:hypothetical protein MA16_Dca006373 [Dendrobium catenatum]|uniref:Uncharacterized protein n=1 Tax=Dendrobium catenatum TaxID=906689 RepID=A0A2I0X7K4_9ASPA|nr:hypothetical protein MA16_Dca006373 [Dendrobium catenatum]